MMPEPILMDLVVRGDPDPVFSDFVPQVPTEGDKVCLNGTDYRVDEVEWLFLRGKFSGAITYLIPITGFGE